MKEAIKMPIVIYQGRTIYQTIKIIANGQPYTLQNNEKILFGVKRHKTSNEYMIFKVLTINDEYDNGYTLILTETDTNIPNGYYIYDIGVELSDGSYQDIQPTDDFVVKKSVTQKGDDVND